VTVDTKPRVLRAFTPTDRDKCAAGATKATCEHAGDEQGRCDARHTLWQRCVRSNRRYGFDPLKEG
jgi:hypothetical protein